MGFWGCGYGKKVSRYGEKALTAPRSPVMGEIKGHLLWGIVPRQGLAGARAVAVLGACLWESLEVTVYGSTAGANLDGNSLTFKEESTCDGDSSALPRSWVSIYGVLYR